MGFGVQQLGTLDGKIEKVGGAKAWVPVQLRTLDGLRITGCLAKRDVAKQLGNHLFEPVRLYGRGKWTRTHDGRWYMDEFLVDTFKIISGDPLPNVVAMLRTVKADWIANPVADILSDESA